jgi:hypothetical protein
LQINVNKRFSNSLTGNFSYTYSHSIDNVTDPFRYVNGTGSIPGLLSSEAFGGTEEVQNFSLDRGSSDADIRHRATFNVVYELPFYKTQQGMYGHLLGGWQLNSIIALQSGRPFTVFVTDDPNNDGLFNDRAVYLGNGIGQGLVNDPKSNGLQYLNPSLFVSGSALGSGNSEAMGRNVFTGPTYYNVDFAIFKNTKVGEEKNIQFRAEFYNLFNRVNFMNPSGNASDPATFNLLTQAYNPRVIQFALRFQF